MNKQEVVAYLVTESTEPAEIRNLQTIDTNSIFYLRFETTLQDFNVKNRNNRIYMGSAMVPSLNADHIIELENKRSWFGEAGHPMTDDIKRILTINPTLISHRIVSHDVNTDRCTGVIETLDTEQGRQMSKLIMQGMEPAFSLRALAPIVKEKSGVGIVKSKAHVVTYDWVIFPSHKAAYRNQEKPIEKIVKKVIENGNVINECSITPVQESMIKDFIKLESTNVKLISNVCEVALGSMTLSEDFRNVVLREGSNTYFVPLEEKIKYDINRFMTNL